VSHQLGPGRPAHTGQVKTYGHSTLRQRFHLESGKTEDKDKREAKKSGGPEKKEHICLSV
jgi:hypothetical protein